MMAAFAAAFDRSRALVRAARRLSTLEYRWVTRYRIWEHADAPGVAHRAAQLGAHMHDARRDAEDAEWRVEVAWDYWSRRLPAIQSVGSYWIAGAGSVTFGYAPLAHAQTEGGFAL
jgi:hypothetical protein